MTRRRGLWLALASVALFLLLGRAFATAYADYRWYAAAGASDVWNLRFTTGVLLRFLAFTTATAIAFANLFGVRHSVVSLVLPRRIGNIEIGEEVPGRLLLAVAGAAAIVIGIVFAIPASDWQQFLLAFNGVPFMEADPYFTTDVGFFVYWLPFERAVYAWSVTVVAAVSIVVVTLYALTPSLRWERGRLHVSTYVRRHVAVLGGVVLALLAWSFRLDAYAPLTGGSGPDGAFGAFDYQLGVPISTILAYAAISAAFVVAWAGWNGQARVAVAVMTVLLLLTPTMQYVLPLAIRWGSAPVDPSVRERPYAANRAGYTRRAYGLELVERFRPEDAWTSLRNAASISVWDPVALRRAIERTRRRGAIVGSPSLGMTNAGPVFVSVEEPPGGDDAAPGGWALVRSLAAVTDERGSIVRVDENGRFPLDDETIGRVLVHEGARGSLIVTDTADRLAAPAMETFGARLSEAWSAQNFRLLGAPATGARMMRRRDVSERVRAITPFFAQSTRIIPIAHGDSLLWSVRLYSTTVNYPLSRRYVLTSGEVSYMRHAATALVHAYTGRVTILPDERADPIAATWIRQLPVTLRRPQTLPASLLALLPPDVDGAEIQAEAFAAVGMREDPVRRHLPTLDGSDTLLASHAPTFVWLPSAGTSAWLVPLIEGQDRVSGVLIATGGARRTLRWFRTSDTTLHWGAALERLQHAGSGPELSPRDPRASGRARVVPLTDGRIALVQPFYGWPATGAPYVAQVAASVGDSVFIAPSMAAAVGAPVISGPEPASPDAKQERMRMLYAQMRAALQNGDWVVFGAAFEAMGALLGRR